MEEVRKGHGEEMAVDGRADWVRGARPTVLIGFAESFAAVEAAWSLQRVGIDVIAFSRAGSKPALRHVPGVTILPVAAPEASASLTVSSVTRLISRLSPDALLPLDDMSLWISSRVALGDCKLIGPNHSGAEFALDKSAQCALASQVGFAVPATQNYSHISQVEVAQYPAMLKPSSAVLLVGDCLVRPKGRVVGSHAELHEAAASVDVGPVLVQPIIKGVGEGIFGYVDQSGPAAMTAHRRVRMVNPVGSASSACESIEIDTALLDPTDELLREVGWSGLFMVEILRDHTGLPWFMELNGRAWGSLALARRRGYEYPAWAAQTALGIAVQPGEPSSPPHVVARHLGRELAHLAFVLRGPQSTGVSDWPKAGKTFKELVTFTADDRWYNWDRSQPRVLWADTVRTAGDLVRSKRKANA